MADAVTSAVELDRSIQSVATISKQADETTRRVAREAEEGGAAVQKSIHALGRVRESIGQSASVIREMGKRTGDISGIVATINLIAERTNLLSLNASIEAARAGDAGRGFAVVAEEIRNLADRAAQATSDIAGIIKSLQDVAHEAVAASSDNLKLADETGQMAEVGMTGLQKILSGIKDTSGLISQIAGATDQQLTAGRDVVASIRTAAMQAEQVSSSTAEQSRSAEEIVRATAQMRRSAEQVSQSMNEQGRAAREIIKAGQNVNSLSGQLRKVAAEHVAANTQAAQTLESMRRGTIATSKAVEEQVKASDEAAQTTQHLGALISEVTRAMVEQATATRQVTAAVGSMRQQSEQLAQAIGQQAISTKDMATASENISRQMRLMTQSNRDQSALAEGILKGVGEIRQVTQRNARGVEQTRAVNDNLLTSAGPDCDRRSAGQVGTCYPPQIAAVIAAAAQVRTVDSPTTHSSGNRGLSAPVVSRSGSVHSSIGRSHVNTAAVHVHFSTAGRVIHMHSALWPAHVDFGRWRHNRHLLRRGTSRRFAGATARNQ